LEGASAALPKNLLVVPGHHVVDAAVHLGIFSLDIIIVSLIGII